MSGVNWRRSPGGNSGDQIAEHHNAGYLRGRGRAPSAPDCGRCATRMKTKYIMIGLIVCTGCVHQNDMFLDADPQGLSSGIVITRPGENGKVNADACTVELGLVQSGVDLNGTSYTETVPYQRHIMTGEQRVAAIVTPGTYTLSVHSHDSYDRWCTNDAAWQSNRLIVSLRPQNVARCIIEYVGHEDGQAWRLRTDDAKSGGTTNGGR